MFSESLITTENRQSILDSIRQNKNTPTVLYGAGIYAQEVERFLAAHSVNVVGCFVDDGYKQITKLCDAPLLSLDEIKAAYRKFNIVIAFCGKPESLRQKVANLNCDSISSVQFFDCRFWERFSELSLEYIHEHLGEFDEIYQWLGDDLSRKTFVSYINTKLSFDNTSLQNLRVSPQYFPSDLPAFAPRMNDVFVDGGAYTGDTLSVFVSKTGPTGCNRYYAFEPDAHNAEKLIHYRNSHGLSFVEVIQCGLWREQASLRFEGSRLTRSLISDSGDMEIKVDSIDRLGIPPSFIKMDIEGAELDALKGAAQTIKRLKPRLAIALYHRPGDLLEIPAFIKSLHSGYRFFLRIHSPMSEEMVLYAIVQ